MHTLVTCLLVTSMTAQAQDPGSVTSGPAFGNALPACTVYAPSGPRAGLEFDVIETIGRGPGAILFVHEISRNVAPMIRAFDAVAQSHRILGLNAFAVHLAADRTAAERQLRASSAALRMVHPMVVSVDGAEGPGAYALNRRCTLTLVVANDGNVKKSIGFTDTGENDVALLRESVESVTGALPRDPGALRAIALERLPTDPAALRRLAAQLALEQHWASQLPAGPRAGAARGNRRPPRTTAESQTEGERAARRRELQAKREGSPPDDEVLLRALRGFIRKDAADERIADLYERIAARAAEQPELQRQTVEMFKLMLSLDYGGTEARSRAKAYLDANSASASGETETSRPTSRPTTRRSK